MDHVDRHELTDLLARLGRCLDEKRFGEVRTVFTEDASSSAGPKGEGDCSPSATT
jgi:hypothetical protein